MKHIPVWNLKRQKMQSTSHASKTMSDLLKRLETLKRDNNICLKKSKEIIERTKNVVLRSSKFLWSIADISLPIYLLSTFYNFSNLTSWFNSCRKCSYRYYFKSTHKERHCPAWYLTFRDAAPFVSIVSCWFIKIWSIN